MSPRPRKGRLHIPERFWQVLGDALRGVANISFVKNPSASEMFFPLWVQPVLVLGKEGRGRGRRLAPLALVSQGLLQSSPLAPPGDTGRQSAFRPRGCNPHHSHSRSAACPGEPGSYHRPGVRATPPSPRTHHPAIRGLHRWGAHLLIAPAPCHILLTGNLRSRGAQGSLRPGEEDDPQVGISCSW